MKFTIQSVIDRLRHILQKISNKQKTVQIIVIIFWQKHCN